MFDDEDDYFAREPRPASTLGEQIVFILLGIALIGLFIWLEA